MIQEREKQAIESCLNKAEGEECTISIQRGTSAGLCRLQQDKLMCIIEGYNRQRQSSGNE